MAYGWPRTLADWQDAPRWIRLLQLLLHYVFPYLVLFVFFRSRSWPWSWWPAVGIEILFGVWLTGKMSSFENASEAEPASAGLRTVWSNAMDSVSAADAFGYSFERFLSGWFLGADPAKIKLGNLAEFISCVTMNKWSCELNESEKEDVQGMVSESVKRFAFPAKDGFDPEIRFASFTKDPLFFLHRSLLQYLLTSVLPRLLSAIVFRFVLGLRRRTCPKTGLRFWWRTGSSARGTDCAIEQPDLLFFHGLCGFIGYVPLLTLLLLFEPARGAVLMELEDVSQCLDFGRQSSKSAVRCAVQKALEHLNHARGSNGTQRRCVILGHSVGTCPAVWILERPFVEIAGVVLVDPIVVLLTLPDVAFSFLYRAPRCLFDWLCFLWCSSEPGISLFFRRRFFWYNNMFDPRISDTVPTVLCLSEHDQMVPAATVRAYAQEHMTKAEISWWAGLGHTYFMGSIRHTWDVVNRVRKMK
eukprot:TRINITY_DN14473_c0_g1_i1.p1 TRINITY_DN14473_c0_g1~~TRINITY_DN14473_c0_g1_i1.p1  ORF type:complete len:471 (+),score=40.17 TRINITY_DN14473_c0_g1_i1:104-1516(+)